MIVTKVSIYRGMSFHIQEHEYFFKSSFQNVQSYMTRRPLRMSPNPLKGGETVKVS